MEKIYIFITESYCYTTKINTTLEINYGSDGDESACQCREYRFHPWVGKMPWRRKWRNPLQHSCLGNPMDRGARGATVCGVAKELDLT